MGMKGVPGFVYADHSKATSGGNGGSRARDMLAQGSNRPPAQPKRKAPPMVIDSNSFGRPPVSSSPYGSKDVYNAGGGGNGRGRGASDAGRGGARPRARPNRGRGGRGGTSTPQQ
ncbi:hypothetical protein MRB53_040377 [Persea americana]|nr:hypothetical protein MRB53_040377 [Persea americana]